MWLAAKLVSGTCAKNTRIASLFRQNARNSSNVTRAAHKIEEHRVRVDKVEVNCAIAGDGIEPVLLLPGSMGSIWTDFRPQLEQLDGNKFTVVAWDPLGYGKSRPPRRTFPIDFLRRDADLAGDLMWTLGHDQFNLVGWSDGGISALMLAAMAPRTITKVVVLGANAYVTPQEIEIYEKIRDIDTWSERMRAPMLAMYGDNYFRRTWSAWIDTMRLISEKKKGDICKEDLKKIRCPTLIVHGEKDQMVLPEHPEYLKANIKNSRLEYFKEGGHNLHLKYPKEFNELITNFLLEPHTPEEDEAENTSSEKDS